MTTKPRKLVLGLARTLLFLLLVWSTPLVANHYSGATISYTCLGGNFYTVDLDVYLDCSGVAISPQTMYFSNSCGVVFSEPGVAQSLDEEVSPLCPSQINSSTCHGGTLPGFRRYRFSRTVYLSPCDYWTMSWTICCRNSMVNVLNTPGTYAEATLNNLGGLCDNSPRFADNGVPYLCVNSPVSYNPGASDPNGNQMAFSLVAGRYDASNEVTYQPGFTGVQPIPGITINSFTGQLGFTPTVTGKYVVVIKVATYNAANQLIGIVMRDLMFVILVCDGTPPIPDASISNTTGAAASGPSSVAVCQGNSFCTSLVIADANPGNTLTVTTNAGTLLPGSTFVVTGTNPVTARLCWTANLAMLPVNVFIDIGDGSCPIENTATRTIYVASCLLLPVELVSFTASEEQDDVLTEWTTASERNTDHYTVERSTDGILFNFLARVEAAGNSSEVQHYALKDESPLEGVSYYRLRETDIDGSHHFSEMVAVDRGSKKPVRAVCDASGGWMITGIPINADWSLCDATGRLVYAEPVGDGAIHVTGSQGSSGMLFLTVRNTNGSTTLKLPGFGLPGEALENSLP